MLSMCQKHCYALSLKDLIYSTVRKPQKLRLLISLYRRAELLDVVQWAAAQAVMAGPGALKACPVNSTVDGGRV